MGLTNIVCMILLSAEVIVHAADPVQLGIPQGFPVTWYGDSYNNTNCEIITQIPSFLDGYFLCETSGSYGDQSNPDGQKLIHLFDGISGVAKFDLNPVQSTYSGAYYPTESYKIWDLYNRDMTRSQVAWNTFYSPWNNSDKVNFENLLYAQQYFDSEPNIDFWKIGTTIVTGTETYSLGFEFDVETLTNFQMYPFNETNPYFGPDDHSYHPIHMTIHERTDLATGLLWNSVFAMNTSNGKDFGLHEMVFKLDPEGHRTIVGDYEYTYDFSKCDSKTGVYGGDSSTLPGYMHSTTSTQNYFIMPLTSMLFNPCIFTRGAPKPVGDVIWDPASPALANWAVYKLDLSVNLRFLLFDKRDSTFRMIYHNYPLFVTHQFNAYEVNDTMLYVDMVAYDDKDYSGLYVDYMMNFTSETDQQGSHLYRFTIDLVTNQTTNASVLPPSLDNKRFEFPQFNHHLEGLKYRYGYITWDAFLKNSSLLKIDMDDPSGAGNLPWSAGPDVSLGEPCFVANPDADPTKAEDEDDGVVLVRGLDISINKSRLYVLDAKTMNKIGEIIAPDAVPFGLHNRYFSRKDLDIPATPTPPSSADKIGQNVAAVLFSLLISVFIRFSFK